MPHPAVASHFPARGWWTRMSSTEGNQDDQGVKALSLWTEAEGMGLLQHGEEMISQRPDSCLLVPVRRLLRRCSQALHRLCCVVGQQGTTAINGSKEVSDLIWDWSFSAWSSQLEGLSREVVQSPSMDVCKTWVAKAQSSLSVLNRRLAGDLPSSFQTWMSLILYKFSDMILYTPALDFCSSNRWILLHSFHFFLISPFYFYLFSIVLFYYRISGSAIVMESSGVSWLPNFLWCFSASELSHQTLNLWRFLMAITAFCFTLSGLVDGLSSALL